MKLVIEYQGKQYESVENTNHTCEEIADAIYENFSEMTKFQLEMPNGGILILGERALKSAVFIFLP